MDTRKRTPKIQEVLNKERKEYQAYDKQLLNTNAQSPNSGPATGTISYKSSSTPSKQLDHYAGPTFHHSPAASNLPIPTFSSKFNSRSSHASTDIHQEQSYQNVQSPTSSISFSGSMHSPSNSFQPYTPLNKQKIPDDSFSGLSIPIQSQNSISMLETLFQADMRERKQREESMSQEISSCRSFDNTLYLEAYSSPVGNNNDSIDQNVFSPMNSLSIHEKAQNHKNNRRKTSYKKNRTRSQCDLHNNYSNDAEDMKKKLLSLLLPASKLNN